jgi:hypothetical protein
VQLSAGRVCACGIANVTVVARTDQQLAPTIGKSEQLGRLDLERAEVLRIVSAGIAVATVPFIETITHQLEFRDH